MQKTKIGLLAVAAVIAASVMPAHAVILGSDLQDWNTGSAAVLNVTPTAPGQQVTNLPCIICGVNQPQQPSGFGYNLFGNTGTTSTVAFFSTSVASQPQTGLALDQFGGVLTGYTINAGSPFLAALGGNLAFSIGVDSNQAGTDAQILESFWFLNFSTHTVLGVFSPGPGGYDITPLNNGTGFPDFTISGLTLAGVSSGDRIGFFARITNANDGPDSFFLLPLAVPGPMVGAGLPGLAALLGGALVWLAKRRRFNSLMA